MQEVRSRWAGTHWPVDLTEGSTGAAILLATHGHQGKQLPFLLQTRKAMTLCLVRSYQPTHRGSLGPLKHARAVLSLSSRLGGSPAASDTGPHPAPAVPANISQCSVLGTWWGQRCSVQTHRVFTSRDPGWDGFTGHLGLEMLQVCPTRARRTALPRSLTVLWCSLRL